MTTTSGSEKTWKKARRQAILDAVVGLLSREGSTALTMDRVAEEAGITKATIYSYFKDKDEMLYTAKSVAMEPLTEAIQEILSSDLSPEVKLEYITSRLLSYCDRNRDVIRVLHSEDLKLPIHKYSDNKYLAFIDDMTKIFEEGVKNQVFRTLNPRGLAFFYVESVTGIITYRILTETTTPVEETARLFLEVFLYGALAGNASGEKS